MSTRDKEHAIKKFTSGPADGRRFQLGEKTDLEAVSDGLRAKIVDAMGRDAHFRRADMPRTGRGAAAAATWIFRGRRVAAPPRPRRG